MRNKCFTTIQRMALVAFSAAILPANAETVYTVTVDGGTRESPVLLDSVANVTVESGGSSSIKAFSEVYGDFSSGAAVFRKRGMGWLKSSVNMATFTGEIRVEEGAFMVDASGMTGPANASTAPTVVVSNGASFAISGTDKTIAFYNDFHLNGSGVNGYGAIANFLGVANASPFKNKLTLDSDATLCGDSTYSYAMGWNKSIDFAGHTLTVKKGNAGVWTFTMDSSIVVTPGHILVDGATLKVQGNATSSWPGTAANTVRLLNGGRFDYYQTQTFIPWTLITEKGSTIGSTSSAPKDSSIYSTNSYNYWDGPVAFAGQTTFLMTATNYGFTAKGVVSGSGSVYGNGGWLQLNSANPAFTGSICINNGTALGAEFAGLALNDAGAITPTASGLTFTNATLRLAANGRYELPELSFHATRTDVLLRLPVTGDQATGWNRPEAGSTAAGIKISGGKTLSIEGDLSVGGVLEIASGCLELPANPHAGFISGRITKPLSYWGNYVQGRVSGATGWFTNSIVRAPLQLYSTKTGSVGASNCVTCIGYIWNRSDVAQDWTFAFAVNSRVKFVFGSTLEEFLSDQHDTNDTCLWKSDSTTYTEPNRRTVTVQPGANIIGIRFGAGVDGGGAKAAASLIQAQWRDGFGVGVDRKGRNSTNAADYEPLADPGDGSFITVSADGSLPEGAEPEWKLSFSHLKISPGAVLEAKGCDLPLKTVEGMGTMRNGAGYFKGRLAISDSWSVSAVDIGAGKCLSVENGKVSFSEDCILEVADLSVGVLSKSTEYVIMRATDGIEGLPSFSTDNPYAKCWRLEKATEDSGDTVLKFVWHKGFSISIR